MAKTRRQSNSLLAVSFLFGILASLFILAAGPVIVSFYQIEAETKEVALSDARNECDYDFYAAVKYSHEGDFAGRR